MHTLEQVGTNRREYPLTTSRKIGQSVLAAVILAGAGFFLRLAVNPIGRDFVLAIGGTSLILGLLLIAQAWTSRLILDGDRIEVRSILRAHSATFADIEGIRKTENQYGRWTRIYLKQDLGSFSVSDFFAGNADLQKWFEGLPDLDCRDADEIAKQVGLQKALVQQKFGAANALGRAKAWAIGAECARRSCEYPGDVH